MAFDAELTDLWVQVLTPLIRVRAVASNPAGMTRVREAIVGHLVSLGFAVREHSSEGRPPILVCLRQGVGPVIGMAGHYDVEEEGDGWSSPAFEVTPRNGRLYGRGTADNLGPLCLRIAVLEARRDPTPPLLWVIQGEEETGSGAAHDLYPTLDLPEVALWLEETGYFESDGGQRLLAMNLDDRSERILESLVTAAEAAGRSVIVHERYLNKAFGQDRCPFLSHLVRGRPYFAIGPNDPLSAIHAPNESLPLDHISLSALQFNALLSVVATL